jgi:hypothetical protein
MVAVMLLQAQVGLVAGQHPLPPNTYTVELAVNDGTVLYNSAFWAVRCQQVPSTTPYVVVVMGTAIDYFRPTGEGVSWCDMFTSNEKHEWSNDGVAWQKPGYHGDTTHNGGSVIDWPKENVEGDARQYLSFWGHDYSGEKGGCCSGSLSEYRTRSGFGQPFSMSYGVPSVSVAYMEQQIAAAVAAAVATEKAAASTIIAEKDSTLAAKDSTITERDSILAVKEGIIAERDSTIAVKEGTIASLTNNLSTCTIALEAKRLARLAETAEDKAAFDADADSATTTTIPDSTDPPADGAATSSGSGSDSGGATAAGIVVTVLVLAAAIGGYVWHHSRTKQQRARDAAAAVGGEEVVEMMENPMAAARQAAPKKLVKLTNNVMYAPSDAPKKLVKLTNNVMYAPSDGSSATGSSFGAPTSIGGTSTVYAVPMEEDSARIQPARAAEGDYSSYTVAGAQDAGSPHYAEPDTGGAGYC